MNFQEQFLQKILSRFEKKAEAVEVIAKSLQIGKDGVYRRIRGVTMLSPEELKTLCLQFKISADSLIYGETNTVFFNYNGFKDQLNSFDDFLQEILHRMEQTQQLPDCRLLYASSEIPIFHYMYFPELFSFKLYLWGRTIWNLDFLQEHPFHFDLIPYPTLRITEQILNIYNYLPSTEIWIFGIMEDTLNQIEFVSSIGQFKEAEIAVILCDKLLELNEHMKQMAALGHKFNPQIGTEADGGSFQLYHNQLVYTSNTLLVQSKVGRFMFTAFANPNYLVTYEQRMCRHTRDWLEQVIRQSSPLSTHSIKNREGFFAGLERKIQHTRQRIEARIGIED